MRESDDCRGTGTMGLMSRVRSFTNDERTEIRQPTSEKAKWLAEAESQGVTLTALVRHAVNEYINRRKKSRK